MLIFMEVDRECLQPLENRVPRGIGEGSDSRCSRFLQDIKVIITIYLPMSDLPKLLDFSSGEHCSIFPPSFQTR